MLVIEHVTDEKVLDIYNNVCVTTVDKLGCGLYFKNKDISYWVGRIYMREIGLLKNDNFECSKVLTIEN